MPLNISGSIVNGAIASTLNYKSVVARGAKLLLDASAADSYPQAGTVWYDISNNGYSGSLTNGPTFSTGNSGYISFDGTNDYVTTLGTAIVPAGSTAYTVSVWVYRNRNNASLEEVLSQWTSANSGNSFYFGFDNSNVRFTDSWTSITVAGAGNIEVWMNLVGVNTGTNAFIYLNGSLSATRGSALIYPGTGPFIIGRQGELDGEYFSGRIGNISVYNRALESAEILQNYNAQKSRFGL